MESYILGWGAVAGGLDFWVLGALREASYGSRGCRGPRFLAVGALLPGGSCSGGKGLGLSHLGREGLRGLDFWDQELWKSQFLRWGLERTGTTDDEGDGAWTYGFLNA